MTTASVALRDVLSGPTPAWLPELERLVIEAEARRPHATYNTGTVSLAAMAYLRAVTLALQPSVAIEIGTFIGSSTFAIHADHVYTCDKDNNCVLSTARVECFGKTRSTRMLQVLAARSVSAQFFFFDGRIQLEDLPLILRLASPRAVFAFDDYEGREKGVINVDRLGPWLKRYRLVRPPASVWGLPESTTIALLEPAS